MAHPLRPPSDAKDKTGRTPLIAACCEGHVEAARLLLEAGADRTLRDSKFNETALEWVDAGNAPEEAKAQLRALLA